MTERSQLPHAPAPDWRRYLLWALIWVCFVAALGYSASQGGLGFLENAVSVTAEPNRDRVPVGNAASAVIEVKIRLTNNTANPATLSAPTACKVFRWQIFARSGDMVQSAVIEDTCPKREVTALLPPGEKVEEFYSIALEAHRFQPGEDYLVHYWYWGYEGEFQFKAE